MLVSGLTRLGVTDWIEAAFTGNVAATALPWLAGLLSTVVTQLASGTATTMMMVSSILFPIAEAVEYNPSVLARMIAGAAHSLALPWSAPTAAATFAAGAVGFGTMVRTGVVATVLTSIAIIVLSTILVPAFGAFTVECGGSPSREIDPGQREETQPWGRQRARFVSQPSTS